MKSKFLLAVALLFSALQLVAQDRTFKSMGYDDATLQGISGSLSYYIKVRPEDNVDQSYVYLNLRASQVLNPNNSFVVVYLKDEAVYTQRIITSALDTLLSFRVPLASKYLQPDKRYIKLRVAVKMSVGDEYCKDIDNPACWLGVKNTSYISAVSQTDLNYQRSIKEVMQEYNSVYTPSNGDVDDLMAGGLVYALLRQTAASKEVYTGTYSTGDSLPQGIICGVQDKLPFAVRNALPQGLASKQGMIALVSVNVGLGQRFVMVVTGADAEGYKQAINVLASNKRLSSAFSDKLVISSANLNTEAAIYSSPLVTTLDELNGGGELMEGIGSLRKKFTFSLADFNAIPTKLTLHLESYFSTLKNDDRGFINIYLNQNLVYNANLLDKANFINNIDLKPHLLSKFNTLEVEFRFHPGSNVCKDGFSNFFAFINTKTSTLTYAGEKENKFFSFFNFPAEFRKKQTKIVVSDNLIPGGENKSIVSSIGELYYQLNAPLKSDFNRLIVPQIFKSSAVGDAGDFNIIALVNRGDAFATKYASNMPVKFDKDFQIYTGLHGAASYTVNDFSSSGLAQIFQDKGNTVLLISALGDSGINGSAYLSAIKNFSTQLTEIESNVCIANSSGASNYFFKAPDDNSIVSYKNNESGLERFLSSYKYWILGLLLVLLVLGFFGVKSKVKKATDAVV
ncbi:MAG: cellulose biosynthesis cyclic di-GMP-binding regulatory protein BcsB [Bacteroidetes bacterium]|nr:cellulose biosynthesis cyclic di-GMP-binding regulatory protein BcsB [Bacteroidota bacterium]